MLTGANPPNRRQTPRSASLVGSQNAAPHAPSCPNDQAFRRPWLSFGKAVSKPALSLQPRASSQPSAPPPQPMFENRLTPDEFAQGSSGPTAQQGRGTPRRRAGGWWCCGASTGGWRTAGATRWTIAGARAGHPGGMTGHRVRGRSAPTAGHPPSPSGDQEDDEDDEEENQEVHVTSALIGCDQCRGRNGQAPGTGAPHVARIGSHGSLLARRCR
jgi:hypothetical protein